VQLGDHRFQLHHIAGENLFSKSAARSLDGWVSYDGSWLCEY
jgi:hypothetical protein